ncbi:MAG: tetratricopeptide repeat protein [Planctomycetales bacterium]|nr:tetratricopeptide repeat protein [Planctomycetales bacterium]
MENDTSIEVEQLLAETIELHSQGELSKAERGYQHLLQLKPQHPDALHLLGVIDHQLGNTDQGIERIQQSLAIHAEQPNALNNLGNMLAETSRSAEAIAAYQRAIELAPDYAPSHHNLGNVWAQVGKVPEAIASYRRALQLRPDDVETLLALGGILERFGDFQDAVATFQQVLTLQPDSIAAYSRLGAVFRKMRRLDDARGVYDQWLQQRPNDAVARHLRDACDPSHAPDRASADYVKSTFDSMAHEFETCLADLDYQVPELLGNLLQKHLASEARGGLRVADLGCGTGLCVPYLRSWAQRLVGVDLSPLMLTEAATKDAYDELCETDLVDFLQSRPAQFDLLVAADTLLYLGDLQATFVAAAEALSQGGHLLFSVEKLADEAQSADFQLSWTGRYQHSASYLRQQLSAAGFELAELSEAPLRNEGNLPMAGLLVLATKS